MVRILFFFTGYGFGSAQKMDPDTPLIKKIFLTLRIVLGNVYSKLKFVDSGRNISPKGKLYYISVVTNRIQIR